MASQGRDNQYTPSIPSPLNPVHGQHAPTRQHKRGNYHRRESRRASGGPVSLAQRLMRHKAAEAFKSLPSSNTIHNATSATLIRGIKPGVIDISRRKMAMIQVASEKDEEGMGSRKHEHPEQPTFFDAFNRHIGLGTAIVDMEKQSLIKYHAAGFIITADPDMMFVHEQGSRAPSILTKRRFMSAVGILCLITFVSAIWSNQGQPQGKGMEPTISSLKRSNAVD